MKLPTAKANADISWLQTAVILALLAFLILCNLGSSTLFDMDEPTYAHIIREMVRSGDWITLHFNGKPWFDKPPLFFWAAGLTSLLLGFTEAAMRLPSALAGIGTLLLTFLLGNNFLGDRRRGIYAALIMAGNLQFYIIARMAVTDMMLTFWITLAFYAFILRRQGHRRAMPLCYVSMAMATLTKGPVGALIPAATILLYLAWKHDWDALRHLQAMPGIIIFLLMAGPWFLAEYRLYGATFINEFFGYRTLTRYLQPLEKQSGPIYFYLVFLAVGFFPWSILLPAAIKKNIACARDSLPLICAAFVFLFFTAAATKLPNYMMPLYPALAVITAGIWPHSLSLDRRRRRLAFTGTAIMFLFSAVMAGSMVWLAFNKLPANIAAMQLRSILPILAVWPLGLAAACLLTAIRKEGAWIFRGTAITSLLFLLMMGIVAYPLMDRSKPLPKMAALAGSLLPAEAPVHTYKLYNASILYYSDHRMVKLDSPALVDAAIRDGSMDVLIARRSEFDSLPRNIRRNFRTLSEDQEKVLMLRMKQPSGAASSSDH